MLKYLKKLDIIIVHPDIDVQIFRTLQEFEEQKILSSGYDEIIIIFKNNKLLRRFLFDNLQNIIKKNLYGYLYIDKLTNFIINLMKMKELTLTKETLKVVNNLLTDEDIRADFISDLHFFIMDHNDAQLIEAYFQILSYINDLYPDAAYDDTTILEMFEEDTIYNSTKEYRDHIVPFFTAAIKAKKKVFVDYIVNLWNTDYSHYETYEDKWFLDEMNQLVTEAESIKY